MYKLEVSGCGRAGYRSNKYWSNFCDHLRAIAGNKSLNNTMDEELEKFGATNEFGTNFLLFEFEEDATVFVLRWS